MMGAARLNYFQIKRSAGWTPYSDYRIFQRSRSDKMKGVTVGLSRRAVLRAGYGAVIAVLVFAAIEAYRIQVSASVQHLEIYRHYVDQDATLAVLRRNHW